jgi:hypothetical protein
MPLRNEAKNLPRIFNMIAKIKPTYTVFCTNNNQDSTLLQLMSFVDNHKDTSTLVIFNEESKDMFSTIGKARQLLLEKARQLDCDFTVFLDGDVIPLNPKFMDVLASWNKDLVGCNVKERLINQDSRPVYAVDVAFGDFETGLHATTELLFPLTECVGFGFHCACLNRKIVQDRRINFLPLETYDRAPVSEDYTYCFNAKLLGYQVFVDNTAKFSHQQDHTLKRPWRIKGYDFTRNECCVSA